MTTTRIIGIFVSALFVGRALNEHLRIIKEKLPGVYGIGIDTTKANYAFISNFPFFQAFGAGDILLDPDEPKVDSPEMIAALEWIQRITEEGYTPVNKQFRVERELMAYGKMVYKVESIRWATKSERPQGNGSQTSSAGKRKSRF